MNLTSLERFHLGYKINQETGCWEWQRKRDKNGYGSFSVSGKPWRVHRFSYNLLKGPVGKADLVCHHCDNTSCCNPEHLFLGTHKMNSDDKIKKGRYKNQHIDKIKCENGHDLNAENTVHKRQPNGKWRRFCRLCNLRYSRVKSLKKTKARFELKIIEIETRIKQLENSKEQLA